MALKSSDTIKLLHQYYKDKQYQKAFTYGNELLLKTEDNESCFRIFDILINAAIQEKDIIKTTDYCLNALKIKIDKTVYDRLVYITLLQNPEDIDLVFLEKIITEAVKHFPDEDLYYSQLITAFTFKGLYKKALYYSLEAKQWYLASIYARQLAIWGILYETDLLFLDKLRKGEIASKDINLIFPALHIPTLTPQDLLNLANKVAAAKWADQLKLPPLAQKPEQGKIKIGYLSSDFLDHATMLLLLRVLELHNKDEFEIHLFYLNKDKYGFYSNRLGQLNHEKHMLHDLSDEEAAQYIADKKLHILVDLKGYTRNSRTAILARRPAPIIVNWLGYPGTLGHKKLADYIIGDPIVTPLETARDFSEKLALMPYSYQPNDNSFVLGTPLSREEIGLPQDKLIFCSFNQIQKLNPQQFDFWCRLLRDIPNSILWLMAIPPIWDGDVRQDLLERLADEANARGVATNRIIFTKTLPLLMHKRRVPMADIALDSFPCTSHTTAADMLYGGVPVIAQQGTTFASRVSSSLVTAHNCPELVCKSEEEAYAKIMTLAKNPDLLKDLQLTVQENVKTSPLFNSLMFTRDLERMYKKMWENYQNGVVDHIVLEPQDTIDDTEEAVEGRKQYDESMYNVPRFKWGRNPKPLSFVEEEKKDN